MTPSPALPLRLRGMAPGDLPGLAAIEARAVQGGADGAPLGLGDLTPFLLRHEVFVAEGETGAPLGFAAAAPLSSFESAADAADAADGEGAEGCFWIGALRVDPSAEADGVARALLGRVTERANWFFCRALAAAVSRQSAFGAPFFRRNGFLLVDPADWTPALRKRFDAQCPPGVPPEERCLVVRWL